MGDILCDTSPIFRGSGSSAASSSPEPTLGRGHRVKVPSVKLRDYVTNTVLSLKVTPKDIDPTCSPIPAPSRSSGISFDIACYVDYNKFSVKHKFFLVAVTKAQEPKSYRGAIKDQVWCTAIQEEIMAFERNSTWSTCPQENVLLAVVGCIKLSIHPLVTLNVARLVWWCMGIGKWKELIIMRPLLL